MKLSSHHYFVYSSNSTYGRYNKHDTSTQTLFTTYSYLPWAWKEPLFCKGGAEKDVPCTCTQNGIDTIDVKAMHRTTFLSKTMLLIMMESSAWLEKIVLWMHHTTSKDSTAYLTRFLTNHLFSIRISDFIYWTSVNLMMLSSADKLLERVLKTWKRSARKAIVIVSYFWSVLT